MDTFKLYLALGLDLEFKLIRFTIAKYLKED